MKKHITEIKFTNLSTVAIVSFLASLIICFILSYIIILNGVKVERLLAEQLILEKAYRINVVISKLLYKTNTLSAMIIQGNGDVDDFGKVAPLLMDGPAISNVVLAPNGIVSKVYPMTDGHDAILGWNFFDKKTGNSEAVAAMETGELVLAGPFVSAQGSQILTGRLPVYIDTDTEKNKFWGLVSIGFKFPQSLDDVDLDALRLKGFSYELWRINPDTAERQVIVSSYDHPEPGNHFIEKPISLFNAIWYLRIWPVRMWYHYPQNITLIIANIIISFLIFFVMQNNHELKRVKSVLENIARSDPLTGIFNRRHFMDILHMNVEKSRRFKTNDSYIVLFDLDKFKKINDTYGHLTGDKVLIEATSRIKALIRPYDLFARYGGEEFIIYASEIDKNDVIEMVERLRLSLFSEKFVFDKISITVSASFGIAHIANYDIKKAISYADKALYMAKNKGRNRTVFNEDNL